jgi:uncharacterized protein
MSRRDFCETFLAALSRGDFDALGGMLAADFVVHEAEGLPYGGDYHGVEGWRALSEAIVATWGGFRVTRTDFYGETENSLVVRLFIKGRSRKNGTPFESSVLELWQFDDGGLLREITPYYWDTQALAAINA